LNYFNMMKHIIGGLKTAVSIPGEANTLSAEQTREAARAAGIDAGTAPSVLDAVRAIAGRDPRARILICGSLYLAGSVLRENG
jgi:dihydrofolate synthase/folylpolyglutamate synthase